MNGKTPYPVLTLPSEIVGEVFKHYTPPYPDYPPLIATEDEDSPTTLLAICRLWRDIALHVPALWQAITLDPRDRNLERARVWIERSGSCLLTLGTNEDLFEHPTTAASALREVLESCRERWVFLDLDMDETTVSVLSAVAPHLRHLTICANMERLQHFTSTFQLDAPRLVSAHLYDTIYNLESLPWSQLKSLTLSSTPFSFCAPVLKEATSLLHCELNLTAVAAVPISIVLHNLTTLVIYSAAELEPGDTSTVDCLRSLTVPKLTRLALGHEFLGGSANLGAERIQALVQRSNSRLKLLQLVQLHSPEEIARLEPAISDCVSICRALFPDTYVEACILPRGAGEIDFEVWLED